MLNKILNPIFILLFWITFIVVALLTFFFKLIQLSKIQRFFRKNRPLSVLYFEVMPKENAGYRYRSGKWGDILSSEGIPTKIFNIFEKDTLDKLWSTPNLLMVFYFLFCWKRFIQCFIAFGYDVVIIRRELLMFNDYGNLFMEKFLASINNKLILDFDDDISVAKNEPRKISFFGKLLIEVPDKFKRTLRFYNYFTPGSNYLKNKILEQQPKLNEENIFVLPTLVDYNHFEPKIYDVSKKTITFGWIGSITNYKNLPLVFDALNRLSHEFAIDFIFIGGEPYSYKTDFEFKEYQWSLQKEIELLHKIDVGLMPLYDNEATRGKCGFKLIQYMGCGIVSVASAVTVNNEIVDDNINGFLVQEESKWYEVLKNVIESKDRFSEIGQKAFEKINNSYSFDSYTYKYNNFVNFVNHN